MPSDLLPGGDRQDGLACSQPATEAQPGRWIASEIGRKLELELNPSGGRLWTG
ncbi:MAG: hypothetical protein ACK2UX_05100 [Anaerolineae bacterium]